MTEGEWSEAAYLLKNGWPKPDEFDENAEAAYRFILGALEPAALMEGIRRCVNRGLRWRPSASVVRQAVITADAPPALTFDEVWVIIEPVLGSGQALARLATAPQIVKGWVASYGVERLAHEPLYDSQHGGAVMHRLRASFEQFSGLVASRVEEGLDPYPALPRSMKRALGTPDFGSVLPPQAQIGSGQA